MTEQEIFDIVSKHLLTQNKKAMNDDSDSCQYRSERGLMCAVGCLIPDSVYTPALESFGVSSILLCAAGKDTYIKLTDEQRNFFLPLTIHRDLLSSLQRLHDLNLPEDWRDKLKEVATAYNLVFNESI